MRAPNVPFTGTTTVPPAGNSVAQTASIPEVAGPVTKRTLCSLPAPSSVPQLRRRRATRSEKLRSR